MDTPLKPNSSTSFSFKPRTAACLKAISEHLEVTKSAVVSRLILDEAKRLKIGAFEPIIREPGKTGWERNRDARRGAAAALYRGYEREKMLGDDTWMIHADNNGNLAWGYLMAPMLREDDPRRLRVTQDEFDAFIEANPVPPPEARKIETYFIHEHSVHVPQHIADRPRFEAMRKAQLGDYYPIDLERRDQAFAEFYTTGPAEPEQETFRVLVGTDTDGEPIYETRFTLERPGRAMDTSSMQAELDAILAGPL